MAVQDTYSETMVAGKAGAIVNMETANLISRNVEDAAGLGFGIPVVKGVADKSAVAFAGTGEIVGITVRERSTRPTSPDAFAQYDSARVMTLGVIWVVAADTIVADTPVYVDATGAFTALNTDTALNDALYDSSGEAGSLVKVRLG